MKTNNPIIDNILETQTSVVDTWMDSAKKLQAAFTTGTIATEGQSIYKEMVDKQTSWFNGLPPNGTNLFTNTVTKPEEFFKNWYTQQLSGLKQITDFNQSIYNSMVNYGKNTTDYTNGFSTINNAWTNIYNSWMGTVNTSYDTFSKNMNNPFSADMLKNIYEGNQTYLKAQELFQPMLKAIQASDFSMETWKNIYSTEQYKKITEQLFGGFFNTVDLKAPFEAYTKQIQNFFVSQNGLGKEYFAQLQNMSANFPELFSGNSEQLKSLYTTVNSVFGKTFEPLLKLVNPSKEKENVETTIALMDKITEFSIKQSELQAQLYKAMQSSMETLATETQEKYKGLAAGTYTAPSPQEMYNEWIKTNEKTFTDLFATEEFSKVKAEALNLTMDVKKQFEKQFENVFEQYPITFKSEMEEVYKTVYELKKTVKELQSKLSLQPVTSTELSDEERAFKAKKK